MTGRAAVFLDRDGVINEKAPEEQYIVRPDQVRLLPGAAEAIARLNAAGYLVIVVTNQRGIGKGLMSEADFSLVMQCIKEKLSLAKAHLDAVYFCPDVDDQSPWRKPNTGMIEQALRDSPDIARGQSWVVGDSLSDQECATRAGINSVLLGASHHGPKEGSKGIAAESLRTFVERLMDKERQP
jgi:D-glycero-D-manno-heptose 1,7-bisphosphate phosphatase